MLVVSAMIFDISILKHVDFSYPITNSLGLYHSGIAFSPDYKNGVQFMLICNSIGK